VVARREQLDEHGVVHEYDEVLSGEALEGGPVMLSWRDVRSSGRSAAEGYNVVIHEFAHVLDMADGLADGVPPLPADIPRASGSPR
jgi:Mlc titration factor MtfA (ptsG expression regulator)